MSPRRYVYVMLTAVSLILAPQVLHPGTRLVYNASASAPLGWYWIEPTQTIRRGDYVVVRLPAALAAWAEQRGYVPARVPLLKRVAARAGAAVCVRQDVLLIDGVPSARLLTHDGAGRVMPRHMPCRVLAAGELVLLNEHAASFDSRYVGPLLARSVLGRATPLWTWRAQ